MLAGRQSHGFGAVILAARGRSRDSGPQVWSGEWRHGFGPEIVCEKGKRPDLERHARAGKGKVADWQLKSWPGEVKVPIWTWEAFGAAKDKRSHLNVQCGFGIEGNLGQQA
jgi:hypothetical protein